MAPPPIVVATIQSGVLNATSNLVAQALMAYRHGTPLVIDWVPVFQFILYGLLNTPPNFLWQEFLESAFPSHHASPTPQAVAAASGTTTTTTTGEGEKEQGEKEDADRALDRAASRGAPLVEPRLNVANTAAKFALDQTLGAAANTLLFSLFIHAVQGAMARPLGAELSTPDRSGEYLVGFLLAGGGAPVDAAAVVARGRAEFWDMMVAGWKLWPLVSLVNFTLVKSIEGRNLVGGLAGMVWGVYMSLIAAS